MKDTELGYGQIPVVRYTYEEAKSELEERIHYCERKYGMSSAEMRKLVSTGDDKWETLEILKWMSADCAYQSLLRKGTPTDGKTETTTGLSTSGD